MARAELNSSGSRNLANSSCSAVHCGASAAAAKTCGHAELCFGYSQAVTDDHLPFRDQGVPVLDLIDLHDNPQWHTKDDTVAHLSAKSLQSVGEILWTALPTIATRFAGADPRRPR